MPRRVAITGIGCVSCFGLGRETFIDAILSGKSGVAPITRFSTADCRSHLAATIRDFDPSAFISPLKLRRVDAVGRMALACTRLLLDDGGCRPDAGGRDDLGIALGTTTAGLDSLVEYLGGLIDHGPTGVPAILFSNTVSNAPASLCAIEYRLRGPNVTFTQREASSLSALAYSVGAIRQGRTTAMVTGGADCVEETYFKVFDHFGAPSPGRRRSDGIEAARPFDRDRNGFVLGEGAFLLLLEEASAASARGVRVYGEVLGVGASASPTRLNDWPASANGLVDAIQAALFDAKLRPDEIAAVIGTANGSLALDRLEAHAVTKVFGDSTPLASIKGAIGESGAAGAAGIIAGLLSLADCTLVPTSGLANLDPALSLNSSGHSRLVDGTTFLVNSVASGGTNYSVVVRACPA